ncbi:MAG: DNA repair protein RecO, partial [Deltaproteobacteria bacterium]|nr:DNA repair protein RecO [Deltaproteobacteria bacterium]
ARPRAPRRAAARRIGRACSGRARRSARANTGIPRGGALSVAALHTEALLLRSADFGESDRMLHLLTPATGRLTAVAKGARRSVKRFGGNLDFFNHLRVQLDRRRPGAPARLDHARLLRAFHGLRGNARRFGLSCYLLELLDRLAPEGGAAADCAGLFAFAIGALERVNADPPDLRLRVLLELRSLDRLGLRPELARCVRCGGGVEQRPEGVLFHIAEGGPLCFRCAARPAEGGAARPAGGGLRVQLGTLRALQASLGFRLDRLGRIGLGPAALREAAELLHRFLRFHIGVELKSERVLAQLAPRGARGGGPRRGVAPVAGAARRG